MEEPRTAVTLREIYDEVRKLKDSIHCLDKKTMETNHLKQDLSRLVQAVDKINRRCKANLYETGGVYTILNEKVDEHDDFIQHLIGTGVGKKSVEAAIVRWLPLAIAIIVFVLTHVL
jgi:hypothetical protein